MAKSETPDRQLENFSLPFGLEIGRGSDIPNLKHYVAFQGINKVLAITFSIAYL
jgi:hypothetical protein